ncbi:MAG: CDP-alcohol phosphatidyltransferase family protein [Leptospirales bacterium]
MLLPGLNIPNSLTLLRILMTPLFVGIVLYNQYKLALWTFFVGAVSDALDGAIARLLNQRTPLGTLLDPVADKIFLSAAVTVIAVTGMVPAWIAIALVSRDIIVISGVVLLKWVETPIPIRPHFWGKLTTLFEIFYLFSVLLRQAGYSYPGHLDLIGVLTVLLAFVSGGIYVFQGLSWFQKYKI